MPSCTPECMPSCTPPRNASTLLRKALAGVQVEEEESSLNGREEYARLDRMHAPQCAGGSGGAGRQGTYSSRRIARNDDRRTRIGCPISTEQMMRRGSQSKRRGWAGGMNGPSLWKASSARFALRQH
eukprot:4734999-Pleurochrysis_carterae.AAC.1